MKIKIVVPEDFSDVTVRQYKAMLEAWDNVTDTREAALDAVCALCDLDRKVVNGADWGDIERIIGMLTWLIEEPDPANLDLPLQKRFKFEGVEYGFIPDWTKLTVGEFADLESYCSQGAYKNLEKILAVVYRPIVETKGDTYDIDKYSPHPSKAEKMLGLTMDIAVGAMLFFYHIGKILTEDTQRFSQVKVGVATKYTLNGGGTAFSMD